VEVKREANVTAWTGGEEQTKQGMGEERRPEGCVSASNCRGERSESREGLRGGLGLLRKRT
jgi:hypothetical protein